MEHESRVLLDLEEGTLPLPTVMVSRRKANSTKSGVWRVCGVFLAVTLCAAAAVCFTYNKVRILIRIHNIIIIALDYRCVIMRFLFSL